MTVTVLQVVLVVVELVAFVVLAYGAFYVLRTSRTPRRRAHPGRR